MAASNLDRTFRLVLYDALASEAMSSLTTGVFLAGFMVQLGASNLAIGVLAAVPFAVQFLQLPAVILVERIRARRAICAWAAGIGRSFLLVAAAAPLLGTHVAIAVLVGAVALYQALAAVAGCAWNSWMRDLVPESDFGRFFGRRSTATTALATVVASPTPPYSWPARCSAFAGSGCCRSRRSNRCRRSRSAPRYSHC
jgi:hypothetical protein